MLTVSYAFWHSTANLDIVYLFRYFSDLQFHAISFIQYLVVSSMDDEVRNLLNKLEQFTEIVNDGDKVQAKKDLNDICDSKGVNFIS